MRASHAHLVDEDDGPLPDGEVGELQIRSGAVTAGYLNDPEATATALTNDGWLRTGDLAYLLDGQLVICGRLKDVIIIGGSYAGMAAALQRAVDHRDEDTAAVVAVAAVFIARRRSGSSGDGSVDRSSM